MPFYGLFKIWWKWNAIFLHLLCKFHKMWNQLNAQTQSMTLVIEFLNRFQWVSYNDWVFYLRNLSIIVNFSIISYSYVFQWMIIDFVIQVLSWRSHFIHKRENADQKKYNPRDILMWCKRHTYITCLFIFFSLENTLTIFHDTGVYFMCKLRCFNITNRLDRFIVSPFVLRWRFYYYRSMVLCASACDKKHFPFYQFHFL